MTPDNKPLADVRIAVLATDGVNEPELRVPWTTCRMAGATLDLLSIKDGQIKADNGTPFTVDMTVDEASSSDYDALILPGGVANPDRLRLNKYAVLFAKSFFIHDKPVAAICHAPWLLIEANEVRGRLVTSWPSLRTDLENAGAFWQNREVIVDDNLITSRSPHDLGVFTDEILHLFAKARKTVAA